MISACPNNAQQNRGIHRKNARSCLDAGKEKSPSHTWQEVILLAGHAAPRLVSRLSPMQLPASRYLAIVVWTRSRIIYKEEAKVLGACCCFPKCLCTPSPFYSEHWLVQPCRCWFVAPAMPLSYTFQKVVVPVVTVHIADKPCRCQWSVVEAPLLSVMVWVGFFS